MASRHKFLLLVSTFLVTLNPPVFTAIRENKSSQIGNQIVVMTVTVWNRSGYVKGLRPESFSILDDKVSRPIEFFESADAPVSVGILIDTSGSMDLPELRDTVGPKPVGEALARFLQLGDPNNEYFMLAFNKSPKLVADWSPGQDLLSKKTEIEKGRGNTALYDACFVAAEKLQTAHYSRRILMLISDGQDNLSRHTFQDLRKLLRDSDITLYAIGMMWPSDIGSALGLEGQGILVELSETTGGKVFIVKDRKQLTTAVAELAEELHHQYRIGFRPGHSDSPEKWRRLKLTVTAPANAPREFSKLSFRTRRGYYSH